MRYETGMLADDGAYVLDKGRKVAVCLFFAGIVACLLEGYDVPWLVEEGTAEHVVVYGIASARGVGFAVAVVRFVVFQIIVVAFDGASADIEVADNHIRAG